MDFSVNGSSGRVKWTQEEVTKSVNSNETFSRELDLKLSGNPDYQKAQEAINNAISGEDYLKACEDMEKIRTDIINNGMYKDGE